MCRTRLPLRAQAVHVRAADDDSVGPQGQRPKRRSPWAPGPNSTASLPPTTSAIAADVDRPTDTGTAAPALIRDDDAVEPRRTAIRASGTF